MKERGEKKNRKGSKEEMKKYIQCEMVQGEKVKIVRAQSLTEQLKLKQITVYGSKQSL